MSEATTQKNIFRRAADWLFGGINMTWVKVIIFAVATAALTAVFLIVPVFDNTSFHEMGVSFEAWILFAVIIMTNCKSPWESAVKTFVFFLISQPLIYLFQVPFSTMGWRLFMYYRYWFFWTLLTLPMAFVGWYLKKGNWLSLLIITPVNLFLAWIGMGYFQSFLLYEFPDHILSFLLCFGQIVLYLLVFFRGWKHRLAGGAAAAALTAYFVISMIAFGTVDTGVSMPLPDDPHFSANATIMLEDDSYGEAMLMDAEEGYVKVHAKKYGSTDLIITDGGKVYRYEVVVFRENKHDRVDILLKE